jgi:hypothetical protein
VDFPKGFPMIPDSSNIMRKIIDDMPVPTFPLVKTLPEMLLESQQPEHASEFHKRLLEYIKEFEAGLDQEHEVGMRLVSFGQSIQFAVRDIGYYNPKLICFYGELDTGSKVQLIQHVNQISFLLLALPRANPSEPKRPIGFCQDMQTDAEAESASSLSGGEE